jgi:hypothetical protein
VLLAHWIAAFQKWPLIKRNQLQRKVKLLNADSLSVRF